MKKRILSILLTLCMVLCLVPTGVFAEGEAATGSAAIQLGTSALSKNVNTVSAPTVYFGQNQENKSAAWRVIGYDGSGVASSQGDMTLLAAGTMGVVPFADIIANNEYAPSNLNNEYAPSNLKTAIDALAKKLTTEENAAVKKRTLTSGSYNGENTDCVAGGQVDNDVFWPLSAKEAIAVNNDLRALEPAHPNWVTSSWWLRSPGSETYYVAIVSSDGSVQYSGVTIRKYNNHRTVRPAFNLNLNSVLFASAAVGGKPDGGLTEVPEYTGNEWKLTLKDNNRSDFAVTSTAVTAYTKGSTVNISYTGAKTGANEYVSALFVDDNGNPTYYGRSNAPLTETDGTVQLSVPAGFAEGSYTLKVFNEQCNGDYNTDYASNFTDIALTVENQPDEQFTLTPGGRYYFDLSAMDIPGTVNSTLDGGTQTDGTLHYVPFTYVGTVDAYSLDSAADTDTTSYEHSLFIANYNVTHFVSWDALDKQGLIFGKTYSSGSIDYTMRAPSAGTAYNGHYGESGIPANNEWDTILKKSGQDSEDNTTGYIKNWWPMASWGQDTWSNDTWRRTLRGYTSAHFCYAHPATDSIEDLGFRPVLELPTGLAADSLKIVELRTGEFMPGEQQNSINIIVKKGESFTSPATEGLPRPDAASENALLWWTDGNGSFYRPGDTVPADVSELLLVCYYDVTYLPGAYGAGEAMTESKRHNVALTLPGALFTRTGHTQVGWATTDGGEKVYGFDDVYTKNEALTLYPVWNTNKYTITFDTTGGSEIAPITQDYGTVITAPEAPTREGYTFIGWDKAIPTTMPAENMTVTAQWEINQYTITFDTNGGSEIAPITQDYGTAITAPANPTREGYTFIGWDTEIPETMPAENMTVTAQWEINQYTITFDTAGGSEIAPITQDYGTAITAPADPTREGYTFIGWDTEIPKTMPAENITLKARWKDTEKPTGEIIIGTNKWHSFLNKLTLGLFFKDTQTVTINASDNSGTVFISYLVTDRDLSETELQSLVYRAYEEPFRIDPNGEYIVYAMLVDESLNITYLRSDRITLDNVQPVIGGIEDGKTYCEAQTVTVDEKYVDTVTVNGTEVTLDENNSFTLSPADGEQKIVVTDKAGNTSEMIVTVNDGHTFGEWASNGDGTHTRQCTVDGCKGLETKDCSGGKATCTEKPICEICKGAYGELDPKNHTDLKHIPAKAATKTAEGNIEYWYCEGCNKYYSDAAATKEIAKADTVTAKLAEDKKPPKTGDTSNLALWIALLFIGGCAFAALTLMRKRQED